MTIAATPAKLPTALDAASRAPQGEAAFVVARLPARQMLALGDELAALEKVALETSAFAGADAVLAACRHLPAHLAPAFLTIRADGLLVGVLAVREQADRAFSLLRGWEHPLFAYGVVLLDARCASAALSAVLASLKGLGLARNGLCVPRLDVDGAMAACLRQVASGHGARLDFLSIAPRAVLAEASLPRWTKERRRQKRRLADLGPVAFQRHDAPAAGRAALETFMALEAASWKGRAGTALLNDAAEASLARALVWAGLHNRHAMLVQLTLAGRVIASAIVLGAGARLYVWKIAHDEAYGNHSPGALLLLELSDWARAEGGDALLDSCAQPGSVVVESIWSDRISVGDAVLQLTASRPAFEATLAREGLRRTMRERAKRMYHRLRPLIAA